MMKRGEIAAAERAAIDALQLVANDPKASASARVAAARAILEHLQPQPAPRQVAKAPAAPTRTPAELAQELAELQAKRPVVANIEQARGAAPRAA